MQPIDTIDYRGCKILIHQDVIFKREGKTDVIACFPGIASTFNPGECQVYTHVGQHGSGDASYCSTLRPAKPEQYASLQRELESIGYNLRIIRKFTRKHYEQRKSQVTK